jgi:hypothetical protein
MLGNNKKNIGFDSSLYNNSAGFSAAALLWKTNIIANGGTIPDATLKIFDTNFFIPATANGNILNQLDRLNIYCGLNGFQIAARTNIISSSFFVSPVSSPTFDNNGYKSSGTSYLNLNYIQSTQAVKLTQNSAAIGCVVKTPSYAALTRMIGATGSTGRALSLGRLTTPALFLVSNTNAVNVDNTNTVTIGNVFFEGIRTNSTQANPIINGVSALQLQNSSAALPDVSAFELTINNNGTPLSGYDTNYHLCSWHGSSALDNTALRTILNNLFTALGV